MKCNSHLCTPAHQRSHWRASFLNFQSFRICRNTPFSSPVNSKSSFNLATNSVNKMLCVSGAAMASGKTVKQRRTSHVGKPAAVTHGTDQASSCVLRLALPVPSSPWIPMGKDRPRRILPASSGRFSTSLWNLNAQHKCDGNQQICKSAYAWSHLRITPAFAYLHVCISAYLHDQWSGVCTHSFVANICICAYLHICIFACLHICIFTWSMIRCLCAFICCKYLHMCTSAYLNVCIFAYLHDQWSGVCAHSFVANICICAYLHVCICAYLHDQWSGVCAYSFVATICTPHICDHSCASIRFATHICKYSHLHTCDHCCAKTKCATDMFWPSANLQITVAHKFWCIYHEIKYVKHLA